MIPAGKLDELDPDSELGRLWTEDTPEACRDWIETFLTVPTELGQIVRMRLYPQQIKMLFDATGRDVTVKGRQTRASSLKIASNIRRMCSGQLWGATCVIGAQDDATTQGVFRARVRHHILNDLASKGIKLDIKLDNEHEFVIGDFENRIVFVSGEQRTLSRGYAAQIIHFSEFSHWKESALELLGGAIPAVPAAPFGRIDLESTPKGEQGAFYEYATTARPFDPRSLWTVHLYPWWLEPRYRVSSDHSTGADILLPAQDLALLKLEFTPSEHEARIMREFPEDGIDPVDRILWRRFKKIEQDRTPAPFLQEYPEDLDTCWLGVQGKFFDTPDGIDHLEYYRDARRQPVHFFEKLTYKGDEVHFYGPNLAVWEYPTHEDTYVAGFDAAGGGIGKNSDFCVLYIYSVRKEKIVARLRVQASPKVFAAMIAASGTFFKTAMISGERSHQGDMVFSELRDLGYTNLYYHVDIKKAMLNPRSQERPQLGLYPTPANRQEVLEKFKTAITNYAVESFCPDLVREMNTFTWQKFQQRMKATALDIVGQHDDCIFAAAHGWYIIDKARNRLKRLDREREEEIITVGRGGLVVRRGNTAEDRLSQLWLGV